MKSHAQLRFPILVRQVELGGKMHFQIRRLFAPRPLVVARRYDRALSQFSQEVKRLTKDRRVSRKTADYFLWYAFNPELRYQKVPVLQVSGKMLVNAEFSVVAFPCGGVFFGYLPAFHHFFLAQKQDEGLDGVFHEAPAQVLERLRNLREESGDFFDPSAFASANKEFIAEAEVNVNLHLDEMPFVEEETNWLAKLMGNTDFEGDEEIEKTGHDLFDRYPSELQRAYCREDLVARLYDLVYLGDPKPLALVGPPGVGKRTLVHEVVRRYRDAHEDTDFEKLTKIWYLDPNRVISGMSIVGQWQKRFEAILTFASHRPVEKGFVVDKLLIDNPVALLRIGKSSQNTMTLGDVLKPYLEKRRLQCILVATPDEWKWVQEHDRRLADLFQVVRVPEPSQLDAVRMMLELRKELEREHDCRIHPLAVAKIFEIHRNFLKRQALPGSAAKLLRQLAAKHKSGLADAADAQAEFARTAGLNLRIADTDETLDGQVLRQFLDERLVGQPEAVRCLEEAIHTVKARLNDPQKPLASFLFIGPTGVGKTQAAKVLCEYLLDSEDRLMRFDMNEYIDPYAMERLLGDEQNPEGLLTGKVRHNPFGVLLLDEIEKAHPKIHDLLLQVLDDGRLTDRLGRTVDFSNTIIIMTSNIGAQDVATAVGFGRDPEDVDKVYRRAVEKFFRPEFVNRIGKIVVFQPLEIDHILGIARLQIRDLLGRDGFVRRTTILNIQPEALEWVARRGFDAKMGGRALKRQIEKDLTALSANQLIRTYSDRPIIFTISLEDGHLVPHIDTLAFIEPLGDDWMPPVPEEKLLKGAFNRLLQQVRRIREDFGRMEYKWADTEEEWHLFILKNRADDMLEQLRRLNLGYGTKFMDTYAPVLIRLNASLPSNILYRRDEVATSGRPGRALRQDQLFLESALDELKQVYAHAPAQFDKMQSAYLQLFVDVALLALQKEAMNKGALPDQIELRFEPVVEGMGQAEVAYLKKHYHAFLDALEAQVTDEGDQLFAEGYGLIRLLAGEEGYHLFYRPQSTPLPIRVLVEDIHGGSPPFAGKVVRLYEIWQGDAHKSSTLTDLRTGYLNFAAMNLAEMKLLVWAGTAGSAGLVR